MAYIGGVYAPPSNSWNPAVAGSAINATDWAALLADLTTALSTCVLKDGTQTITANLPMGGFKLTGLVAGSAAGDSATIGRIETLTSKTLTAPTINAATLTGAISGGTFTGSTITNPANTTQALTDAAPTTWDTSLGAIATWTMAASRTISAPTNLKNGGRYVLIITQDATGGRSVTWNGVFKNSAGSMPQPNQQAGSITAFTFTSPDGTNLRIESNEAVMLLATSTASASASLDFTNLTGFGSYLFVIDRLAPATDATNLHFRVSTDNGSTFISTATYAWASGNQNSAGGSGSTGLSGDTSSQIVGSTSWGNGSNRNYQGLLSFCNSSNAAWSWNGGYQDNAANVDANHGYGYNTATGVNAVRFISSSGNIASGIIKLYGIRG